MDAQRRKLSTLAREKSLMIVHEYTDVVESAKSEHRPAFQDMLKDLKSPIRQWDTLLLVDTSRLSRRRYVAQVFKHEARKRGVDILYSKVPDTDPITSVILESVFEAMDEVHSLMSREKGLAGMTENVRQGYRAGGRAPKGYKLNKVGTGATREGQAVEKSVLVPNNDSKLVSRFLKARAAGTPRAQVVRDLNIPWPVSTLIGMEWRALTYAGHTVWNQSNPQENGRYVGGTKYRPRDEWVITNDTHEALITVEEAEAILVNLQNSNIGQAVSRAKQGLSSYLLTGMLKAPDGRVWQGVKDKYRLRKSGDEKGRVVPNTPVDNAVINKLIEDFKSEEMITALLEAAHTWNGEPEDPAKEMRSEVIGLNEKISKAMDISMQLDDPGPALRKVNELEAQRKALTEEISRVEREYSAQVAMQSITREQVSKLIAGLTEELEEVDRPRLKGVIQSLVDHIILDPEKLEFVIQYRIPVDECLSMASPRGVEPLLPA
ncbi:MAG: recombinase family protein [Candidatus Thiodiazotropha sp.]